MSLRPFWDPRGRVERIPARELLDDIAHLADDAVIMVGPMGLVGITAGEIRELATKGQAIDVPRLMPDPHGIWEVGT